MLITPNVLHLESEETIVVDGQTRTFDADVEITDFPQRKLSLAKQKVSINSNNKFLGTAVLTVNISSYQSRRGIILTNFEF